MTPHVRRLVLIANNHVWLGTRPSDARVRIAAKVAAMPPAIGEQWALRILARWVGIHTSNSNPQAYNEATDALAEDEVNNHEGYMLATGYRDIRHAMLTGAYAGMRLRAKQAPKDIPDASRPRYWPR